VVLVGWPAVSVGRAAGRRCGRPRPVTTRPWYPPTHRALTRRARS